MGACEPCYDLIKVDPLGEKEEKELADALEDLISS